MKLVSKFKAALDSGVLSLDVYGDIGENYFGDGITAKSVSAAIKSAGKFDSITLNINSGGGDCFEGVAIRNLLIKTGKPITAEIDGLAASAASIIAMAGSKIVMRAGSMLMIHNAWTICVGDSNEMREMANTLEQINEAIAGCYAEQSGLSVDEIKTLMAAETWLTADKAKEQGLATDVLKDAKPQALAMARTFKALAKFQHVPEQFKAAACACGCVSCMAGNCDQCTNADCVSDNCEDCPMQKETAASSNLSLYEARLKSLTLTATH